MKNNQVYYQQGGGDEQYTPRGGVDVLLPYIQHLKDKIIWCPFDKEDSQFVKVLTENGFNVIYSHLEYGQDFLTYEPEIEIVKRVKVNKPKVKTGGWQPEVKHYLKK